MAKSKANGSSEVLRRLSAKDIMEQPIKQLMEGDEPVRLFLIYGIATGTRTKDTTYGPATAVMGQFEAVRISDGAIFGGYLAYLPEPLGGMLVEAVKNRGSEDKGVEFSAEIGIKPSKKAATGYEYTYKPHLKPEEKDALSNLRSNVKGLLTQGA